MGKADVFDYLARVDEGYSASVSIVSDGTAYQAQISNGRRRSSDKEFRSGVCELARPIRRIVLGLLAASTPGLLGANTRPIRRSEGPILPVIQCDVDLLTV